MMISHAAFLSGYSLGFAGAYLGNARAIECWLYQGHRPAFLIACTVVGAITSLAGAGVGFWLFGWAWLLILIVATCLGGWLAQEAPRTIIASRLAIAYNLIGAALVAYGVA